MTPAMQIALTATPLAVYFYVLGVFHCGRGPRMIAGPIDVAMLAFGLGGLVAFGPFGRAVLGRLVGVQVGIVAWSLWVSVVVVWALVLAASASLRVTIYQVTPEDLKRAVHEALGRLEGRFVETLNGFEDSTRGAGLRVKSIRLLRSGSVEAFGSSPELLIRELKPELVAALGRVQPRASGVSHAMFALACLTMLVPVSSYFLSNPRAKEALRAFMQSLRWW
jgi:hypothetical protein